jgi:hypothetical protein
VAKKKITQVEDEKVSTNKPKGRKRKAAVPDIDDSNNDQDSPQSAPEQVMASY